jgi:ubiquinol oxidase
MSAVTVAHRGAKTISDKVALMAVKTLKWGSDLATGYKHQKAIGLSEKDPVAPRSKFAMSEQRMNAFLESVSGVPGS